MDNGQIGWAYIWGGLYTGWGGAYIWEEKHFNLQSVKLTFLSFFKYKAHNVAFSPLYKMCNMFKVNNKDTRICKVNDKLKNKGIVDGVLTSLLLTLNIFHFLLQCFCC